MSVPTSGRNTQTVGIAPTETIQSMAAIDDAGGSRDDRRLTRIHFLPYFLYPASPLEKERIQCICLNLVVP